MLANLHSITTMEDALSLVAYLMFMRDVTSAHIPIYFQRIELVIFQIVLKLTIMSVCNVKKVTHSMIKTCAKLLIKTVFNSMKIKLNALNAPRVMHQMKTIDANIKINIAIISIKMVSVLIVIDYILLILKLNVS